MFEREAPHLSERDYRDIETALAATVRGREFLNQFARRNRGAETQMLLDAVAGLERAATGPALPEPADRPEPEAGPPPDQVREARPEIARLPWASSEPGQGRLEDLLRTAQQAIAEIQDATEHVQDLAWRMRESGFDAVLCGKLDRWASAIAQGCARHSLAARAIHHISGALTPIRHGLEAMTTNGSLPPKPSGSAIPDRSPSEEGPHGAVEEPLSGPVEDAAARSDRLPAPPASSERAPKALDLASAELERLNAMDIRDKLRLFT